MKKIIIIILSLFIIAVTTIAIINNFGSKLDVENKITDLNNIDNKKVEQKEGYEIIVSKKDITVEKGSNISFEITFTIPDVSSIREYITCKDQNDIIIVKYSDLIDRKITVEIEALKVGTTEIEVCDYNYPNTKEIVKVNVIEAKDIDVSVEYTNDSLLSKFFINNHNVFNSMIDKANYNELKLKNKLVSDNMAFINVYDNGTQFDENHLFIYDSNGKIIDYFHLLKDKDNDNNSYKYNGDFKYDTDTKTLTFTTELWLGEGEESTGVAFNDKLISELSKSELERFKNYAYEVKYEYELKNGKFEFTKKDVLSKLINNEFYKEYFN